MAVTVVASRPVRDAQPVMSVAAAAAARTRYMSALVSCQRGLERCRARGCFAEREVLCPEQEVEEIVLHLGQYRRDPGRDPLVSGGSARLAPAGTGHAQRTDEDAEGVRLEDDFLDARERQPAD